MLNLFVTVGSTRFDALINEIITNLNKIEQLGFTRLIIQAGKSAYNEDYLLSYNQEKKDKRKKNSNEHSLEIDIYDYKNSILDDIKEADVVVGHAGAGTCLEVLRSNKKLLVVVNETLMDNHQSELADELSNKNYVLQTNVANLHENLGKILKQKFEKFPSRDSSKFEQIFDDGLFKAIRMR